MAVGVVLDPEVVGEAEARRRVMAWWAPGCEVRAAAGLWIVRGGVARRIRVVDAPGAPLVEMHGGSAALPVAEDEMPAPGVVVVARGGALVGIAAGEGEVIDPAGWLEIGGYDVVEVEGLSAEAEAVAVPVAVAAPGREQFGIGAAEAEAGAVAMALRATEAGSGAVTVAARKAPWWARAVARVFGSPRGQNPGGRGRGRGRDPDADGTTGAAPETWLDRLRARAALAIWKSALGRAIGRRHADYLRETLDLFDRGELDEALRRAVPLGGDGESSRLGVGLPARREAITPSLARAGGGSVIPVADQAMQQLRARYQAARDRLIRDGRIEEAAFVIADLLGDAEAAVALLERHGRLRLAAELAEARDLAAGLVIRQWFLAGEVERAVAVARRTGAFAAAVERAGAPEVADRLRLMWAAALAEAGDYLGAVEVVDQLADPRRGATVPVDPWIELGIAGGGVAAAWLWIRRLGRAPERFAEVRAAALGILTDAADEALAERIAIAEALTVAPPDPGVATLARAAVRAMLADLGRGVDGEPATLLPRLVRVAADPALRADLPALGTLRKRDALVDRPEPTVRRWARSDAGTVAVHDVALLPGGRLLIALGELGVRLLAADGRTVARWDQPAEALVVSDHGTAAIAVASRGAVRRLARIDLARRQARPWFEAALHIWAPSFDGALWLVGRDADLLAVDVHRDDLRASWGVSLDADAAWSALARDGDRWAAAAGDLGSAEVWCYQRFTLRRRSPVVPPRQPDHKVLPVGFAVLPDSGGWVIAGLELADQPVLRELVGQSLTGPDWRIELDPARWRAAGVDGPAHVAGLTVAGRFAAVDVAVQGGGRVVEVFYLPHRRSIALLGLEGAGRVSLRFEDLCLCVADDRGRVVVLDLRTGSTRRDLRIR